MKHKSFDKNWKYVYSHRLQKLAGKYFVATIALNKMCVTSSLSNWNWNFNKENNLSIDWNNKYSDLSGISLPVKLKIYRKILLFNTLCPVVPVKVTIDLCLMMVYVFLLPVSHNKRFPYYFSTQWSGQDVPVHQDAVWKSF